MRKALPALLAAVLLATGCGAQGGDGGDDSIVSGVTSSDNDGYTGVLLPKPYPAPTNSLETDAGKPFSWQRDTSGRLTLVFFGYTNCPDVCQVIMGTLASAYARLSAAEKKQVQVTFVTTDPERDTPEVLRSYLDRLDPSFTGLTGSIDQIDASGRPLQVFIKKGTELPSGGYEVDHTTYVFAVDGHGSAPLVWTGTDSPAQVAADVKKLLADGAASAQEGKP